MISNNNLFLIGILMSPELIPSIGLISILVVSQAVLWVLTCVSRDAGMETMFQQLLMAFFKK